METIISIAIVAIPAIPIIAFLICSAAFPRFNTMVAGLYATLLIFVTLLLVGMNFYSDDGLYGAIVFGILIMIWVLYHTLSTLRAVFDEDTETHVYLILGTLIEERGPGKLSRFFTMVVGGVILAVISAALSGVLMWALSFIHLDILTLIIPIGLLIYCIVAVYKAFADDWW